jgi:hypothetical protein
MQIYIFKNNEQFGPFDAAQIEDYIKTNIFDINDFAWAEGETEWIPLSDLLLKQTNIQDVEDVGISPSPAEIQFSQEEEAKILTPEIAEQFLKNSDAVALSEFTTIEDEAAPVLARYKGRRLNLMGLTSLSDTAANALSQYNGGRINLAGVKSLTSVAAQALTQQDLVLDSLRNLSNATAHVLMKHKGMLLNMPKETRSVIDKLVRAEAEKAKAQAQAKAHAIAQAEVKAKNRSESIKTILVIFWAVTPLAGIVLFAVGLNTGSSFCAVAGFIGICLPILGIFVVAALNGDSNPQQRNAQIAMIQRQQMMNKIDDIRSDLSDE